MAGRMAIHAVKVEDFHSKLTSCLACRMAIHAVKVEDFHSKRNEESYGIFRKLRTKSRCGEI